MYLLNITESNYITNHSAPETWNLYLFQPLHVNLKLIKRVYVDGSPVRWLAGPDLGGAIFKLVWNFEMRNYNCYVMELLTENTIMFSIHLKKIVFWDMIQTYFLQATTDIPITSDSLVRVWFSTRSHFESSHSSLIVQHKLVLSSLLCPSQCQISHIIISYIH